MILNSGLDAACTADAAAGTGNAPNQAWPVFCRFIQWAAFGTGSSAPDPTDTSLDAQVGARSNSRGEFANTSDTGLDAGNNIMWSEQTFTRVFSIASNVNATEWGLAPAASGALSVRDLFRADPTDPNSSPITLTLEAGDQLQLVITLRVQATWEYEAKSFTITGTAGKDTNGTHDGNATVSSGASTNEASVSDALAIVWPGGGVASNRDSILAFPLDQTAVLKNENLAASDSVATSASAESYTPNSYFRDWTGVFSTNAANFDHHAWLYGTIGTSGSASGSRGLRFILTNPPHLTKTSTHRLTLTVRKHISRL